MNKNAVFLRKPAIAVLCFFIVFTQVIWLAPTASAAIGPNTITFSSNNGIPANTKVVSDGQGGSSNIAGIDIEFSAKGTSNNDLNLTHEVPQGYSSTALAAGYAANTEQSAWYIKSSTPSENFSLHSIQLEDYGLINVRIGGFDNGTQIGNWIDLSINTAPSSFTFNRGNGLTSIFDNVDEIQIVPQGSEMWIGINNVQINDPVLTPPSITSDPANKSVTVGGSTSFTASASNANNYQWQVNKGSGFVNISNVAPYSGAYTSTLSLSSVTADMNGYLYQVVASGAAAPDAISNQATLTVIVPVSNFMKTVHDANSAAFTWNAANGASNIVIQQSPAGANTWTTATTGAIATNATTATVTGLNPATAYDFRLVVTGGANAGNSNTVTVTTNTAPVTNFTNTNKSASTANFTWSGVTGASTIVIQQSPVGANTWSTATTGVIATNATTATVSGLNAAVAYDFRLVVTGGSNAGSSNVATVTTNSTPITSFAIDSKSGTTAGFSWSAASGASSIIIEQSPAGAGTWTTATTGAIATSATTATVTGLSPATAYDFRLVVTGGANAGNSNEVTVTTDPAPISSFTNTSKTGTTAVFTWSAASGATGVTIEQSPAGANTWATATTGAIATNATTATVTGLDAITSYDFRLVVTGGANAGNSNVETVTTSTIPVTSFANTSKTGTTAVFTWSVVSGATGISVEQSPAGAGTWTIATTGAISTNVTTATVTGLAVITGYDFRLVVTGGANAGNSNVETVTTSSVPVASFANTSKSGTTAVFTWSAVSGATGIIVEQSPAGAGTWTTATTGVIATSATIATVNGLDAVTGYDFRLVVTGGANAGNSNVETVTTSTIPVTSFANTSKTGTTAVFTWSAVSGATGITVEQSPAGAGTWTTATTGAIATSATTATVTELEAAESYDFRLVVTGGTDEGDSNTVTVTTNAVPLTSFADTSKTSSIVTFAWSAAIGATNIVIEQSPIGTNTWTTATTGTIATNATSATATGLSASTGYDFRLVITGGANEGISNVRSVVTAAANVTSSTPSTPAISETGIEVLVNGKVENAGIAVTTTVNGQQVVNVKVDQARLEKRLAEEGQLAIITFPLPMQSDVFDVELNGQMIMSLKGKEATIVIQNDQFTYTLPASQINIQELSDKLGKEISLNDIKVNIGIAEPLEGTLNVVASSAEKGGFVLAAPSLNFTVHVQYGNDLIELTQFDVYIERTIAIPDGVDPNKITTGIVVESDGTVRHVPTRVVEKEKKYYARVNSLTNSTYSIIWNPITFKDVEQHWSKDAVNDMGSRLVISGVGNELFNPNQDITRAEFAAIIVRGLGLKQEQGTGSFSDVKAADWYSGYIQTAYEFGLINGFEDGTFRPMDKISREQAMAIVSKAMKLTGLSDKLPTVGSEIALHSYVDESLISAWALESVQDSLQAGIITGRSETKLAPKEHMTRAEVAAMIQRLLTKSDLI
ncbi:S-layer homology domain-containing protein [Paenibacillus sinopodophylli]|uniref:S-layer homology domain-containing protein n=1 Tax=Paenibacillus sinopodophylli TaxID=1837342 RepID=UPI00110CB645|nr:S-layer homology domain-containing protein [Paenibacillus sinopodophylli]